MSKLNNKVSIAVVSIATVLSLSGAVALIPATANGATAADVQAQIAALMAQIQALQGQLQTAPAGSSSMSVPASLLSSGDLTVGSKSSAVMDLQRFLNGAGYSVAKSGVGSMGNESTYFGNATKAALMKWQAAAGISPASGYFGAKSRAKLQSLSVAVVTNPSAPVNPTNPTAPVVVTPSGAAMSAMLASAQPTGTLAPVNAGRVPFTTVTLTAGSSDVTVNSLTVQREGVAQDAAFAGLVLIDSTGMQIGDAKTLNSNHQANIGNPFVIKAGSSKTVTVAANMAASLASYDGQVASFGVVAVNTADNSTFTGLPLVGVSLRLVQNITLGSVTAAVSSYDPASANNQQIGTTGYKFAGVRLTAGSAEQVNLMSIRFNQSGSASATDLANVKVYVDGTAYNTTVDSTGKYYSATFGNGILIDKGLSKDVWIQGDIVGSNAANRTVQFDIYKNTDIYMTGVTYGYGIVAPVGAGTYSSAHATSQLTTSNPWFQSAAITIAAGSATTINKSLSVPAQNIAVNVPNQVLGGFDTNIMGESLSVQSMKFTVASTSGSGTGLLTSVSLYQGNTVVAGPVDAVYVSPTTQTVTFTDTVTIPVGITTYTLKGKVASGINNSTQYSVSTNPGAGDWSNITGNTTGNNISLSSIGNFTMNTMTVQGAALAVYVSPTPASQTVVANRQNLAFANIQLDATQSGEDMRLSVIPLYSTGTTTDMTSCELYDGANLLTSGSNVYTATVAATASTKHNFNLDQTLTVSKGTVKTLGVVCNLNASLLAGNQYKWGIGGTIASDWTATGVTSGATVTVTGTVNAGNAMVIGTSALTAVSDSTSPSYALAYDGQTGVVMGVLKFHASSEAMSVHDVALQLTNTASSSASDLVQATLWDGTTQVGTVAFSGANTVATTTGLAINVPADSDKLITVKADMGSIGNGLAGHQGALIAVDLRNAVASKTQSGGDIYATGAEVSPALNGGFAGVRLFNVVPTFARIAGANTSFSGTGTYDLYRFSITASPANSNGLGIDQLVVGVATSTTENSASTTVNNLKIFAYSDSAMSNPVTTTLGSGQVGPTLANLISTGNNTYALSAILEVGAGQTMYFRVVGDVAFTHTSGTVTPTGYISTKIIGDPAGYPSLSTLMGAVSSVSTSNFIWSPNATTTSNANHVDWTNGYKVVGLDDVTMATTTMNKQ